MSKEASTEASAGVGQGLFGREQDPVAATASMPGGKPRVQRPDRQQVVMHCAALDDLLAPDHTARVVWEYAAGVDLAALYQRIEAVEGHAGRSPIDPRILLGLWLYATLDGVGSARELDRLCGDHKVYEWICGGVSVNYHTLADFRTKHVEFLDQLLTDSVASLLHQELVTMQRVAQDGVRVRAQAGAGSFRRRATLEECQQEARAQVEALQKELEADPAAGSQRQRAARERAARERSQRVQAALAEMEALESKKKGSGGKKAQEAGPGQDDPGDCGSGAGEKEKQKEEGEEKKKKPAEARVSTTDPAARVMKMGDGGFRPAFNVQFATDTASQVITGVGVSNVGSDQGQMAPMFDQHQERYAQTPQEVLVDGGFAKQADIEKVSAGENGAQVYAPVQKARKADQDPHQRRAQDSDVIAEWRQRMASAQAKEIYKERAATAECVNAIARNRGLRQFLVRGLEKVKAVVLWFALAHNLMRAAALRAGAALAAR